MTEYDLFKSWDNYPVGSLDDFLKARTRMFNGIYQNPYSCGSNKGSRIIKDIFPN